MMDRMDAERAKSAMTDIELFGLAMRIGWGKAMPKGPVPCYVAPSKGEACRADNVRELPSYRRSGEVQVPHSLYCHTHHRDRDTIAPVVVARQRHLPLTLLAPYSTSPTL